MSYQSNDVCVIIPAWNAEATIDRAIASVLCQPEVVEVVVVDDASTDGTLAVAHAAAAYDRRINVIAQPINQGPAAARNSGIAGSTAPFIALLDSDDFFLPRRFAPMFAVADWDAIADNIAFVAEEIVDRFSPAEIVSTDYQTETLSFTAFVAGNVNRRGRPRAELGFAKPLLRRAFLEDSALYYDETLRLGEDYALYARLLASGGRFRMLNSCGYVAVERHNSLSGRHSAADLAALLQSDVELQALAAIDQKQRRQVDRHRRQLLSKVHHRTFLDCKRLAGLLPALSFAISKPEQFPSLVAAILSDKLAPAPKPAQGIRYLF